MYRSYSRSVIRIVKFRKLRCVRNFGGETSRITADLDVMGTSKYCNAAETGKYETVITSGAIQFAQGLMKILPKMLIQLYK